MKDERSIPLKGLTENKTSESWLDIKDMKDMERIKLWKTSVPGNSRKLKDDVMEIGKRKPDMLLTLSFIKALPNKQFKDCKQAIDTYTKYCVGMVDDEYHETFEDEPYLIPFIAEGSKKAVIVVPGGGYTFKSMEGEGTQIAEALQKSGITAFVLWYRTNPYYQPIPLMDMQRAVRYVRYHAKEYGYEENQIGAIGFSAGGAQVSLFMNIYQGKKTEYPGYEPDEIDKMDDRLNFAALIYPALSYLYNKPMLFASFPAENVRQEAMREEYLDEYNAVTHMRSAGIPHYIGYGTKDDMVSLKQIEEYVKRLDETGTPYRKFLVDGAGHGYGAAIGQKFYYWLENYISWLKNL